MMRLSVGPRGGHSTVKQMEKYKRDTEFARQ